MSTQGPLHTDVNRYRYGDIKPVDTKAIDTAVIILKGDLVYRDALDADKYKSSQSILDIGGAGPATLAAAQELFHDTFLGPAEHRSLAGEVLPIVAGTAGVYEYECEAATFNLGDLVGIALDPVVPANIDRQRVVAVATPNLAIGRVVKDYPANTDTVLVEVLSSLYAGGPQAIA